jgi:hypothetical protein
MRTHQTRPAPVGYIPPGQQPHVSREPQKVRRQRDWLAWWTAITTLLAWVLANGLDVFSVLILVQSGGRLAFARFRPAESFVIYAGLRVLGTLAVSLGVVSASRRWPSVSRAAWGALTACALATAAAAWWRLYR